MKHLSAFLASTMLMLASALATTTAPTPLSAPGAMGSAPIASGDGGLAQYWWVILIVLIAAAALWYFLRRTNRTA
jgi:uncharacterized protein HemX